MKVKELLAELQLLDPEKDVLCYCDDEGDLPEGRGFRIFQTISVELKDAEGMRLKDNTPYLKFGKTPNSQSEVLIEMISDF